MYEHVNRFNTLCDEPDTAINEMTQRKQRHDVIATNLATEWWSTLGSREDTNGRPPLTIKNKYFFVGPKFSKRELSLQKVIKKITNRSKQRILTVVEKRKLRKAKEDLAEAESNHFEDPARSPITEIQKYRSSDLN